MRRRNAADLVPIARLVEAIYEGKGRRTERHGAGELVPLAGVGDIDALGRVSPRGAMQQQRLSLDETTRGRSRSVDYRILLTRPNDVLVPIRGSVWKAGAVGPDSVGVMPSNNLALVRPKSGVLGGWLAAVLGAPRVRDVLGVQRGGPNTITASGFYLGTESLFSITLPGPPPLDEQRLIAEALRVSADGVTKLEAAVLDAKIAHADLLERLWV